MPLKLVTGPANAAKAGEVLGGLRARLADEPVLVVPAFGDVEHAQRELAETGAVFGAGVVRFQWLFELIAQRTGYSARKASELQRDLIVEDAVRRSELSVLRRSAERPGFVRAAAHLVSELGRSMVEPERFSDAMERWAGGGPRRGYAAEVAAIYSNYAAGLEAAGLVDEELFAWRALNALRRVPGAWGRTPVFAYGFDDLTPLEFDALETLAIRVGADVTVSLPYEPGREAFRAIAALHQDMAAIAAETLALEPLSDHYASGSREALHHLERHLFEEELPVAAPAGAAVRVHSAGGTRAEVELAAAEVLHLLAGGTPPGEVAVVFRDPGRYASVVEQVFGSYGIPYSIDASLHFSHTGLGRGLLALMRCADGSGQADDLIAWLRTPGWLRVPGLADRLEADVRKAGVTESDEARAMWEEMPGGFPLNEIDRLRDAPGLPRFLIELDAALTRLFSAPYERTAPVLAGAEVDEARTYAAARDALHELHELVSADPRTGVDRERVRTLLGELDVRAGKDPQPDRVQVADPGAIRARRFQAVLLCGLQEGEFPRRAASEPFLPDDERRALSSEGGLRLPLREDQLERERYLFYVCVSRAERQLVLSARYCDEEGSPEQPSFFLDDVKDLFEELPERRRSLSQVTWEPEEAPTVAEWERAAALRGTRELPRLPGPLSDPEVLAELAGRDTFSAGALEAFADCPVKWLMERLLDPLALEPDPEYMVRGLYAHKVLKLTFERLQGNRVTEANLPEAERLLLEAMGECQGEFRLSPRQSRVRAAVRRLEFDLLSYLRREAASDSRFQPSHFEWPFDGVPLEMGLLIRGRVDRVDVWDGHALVRDYKTGASGVADYKVASWQSKRRLQAALYMLAVAAEMGLEPAGGVYTPIAGSKPRSRGLVARELAEELGSEFMDNDLLPSDEFEHELQQVKGTVYDVVERMKLGQLSCTPETCTYREKCAHPTVCRVED